MFHHEHLSFGPRGRGFGGFRGGFGGIFGGFGEHGGPNLGAGRKVNAADLQLLILGLLEEKPRHGYELIKELEERSGGFYTPSPGVIYPALTYLEELNYASVETSGSKKLYSLTEEGRKYLEDNRKTIEMMMSDLERVSAKMQRMRSFFNDDAGEDIGPLRGSDEFVEARMQLKGAIRQKWRCSPQEANRIAAILRRAAAEILGNE